MAKEAYYFSHDANARHDDKILELRAEFGWEGYGLFWAVVETLRDCSNYSYPSNAKAGLALSLNIDKAKLNNFLDSTFKLGLLVEKEGVFYSESLMKRMEDIDEKRRKRAEAGRLGGNAKAMAKQKSGNAKAKASKESKEKDSKVKESKIKIPFRENVFLLDTEYSSLVSKHGEHKTEWMLDKLSSYKLSKDVQYKSDYGAINTWVVDSAVKGYSSSPVIPISQPKKFSIMEDIKRQEARA